MISGDLFNPKTIQRLCEDVKITQKQKQASKEWLKLLDDNKLQDEKSNYPKFMEILLQDILGYPIKEIDFESGNVEFQFRNSEGKNILCFEAKGTSTKDLFAPQHRIKKEHETPIKQTWDYMGSIGLDYGICTNYKDFVLISKQFGYSKYHFFDFNSIKKNEEKIKEFVGIFSKERIIEKGFVEKLQKESIVEEREFTKEFYKLFHETRLMMIKSFKENKEVTKDEAIHYTQLYLNRLIFMFFAEDHDFLEDKLFTKRVTEVLNSPLVSEHSKMVSDEILGLFQAMDKGSHRLGVFGFNGGLFKEEIPPKIYFSDIKDVKFFKEVMQNSKLKIKPNAETQKIINTYQNELNPIIVNLFMMDSFDFTTEINVNILGHIFEQSISDLEELKQEGISRRKKDGVFYTPEYITDYICRNTIIPYLSKLGVNSIHELIDEYVDNIEELEKKFQEIKILDPACGSGAFLVKAVDVLLEIHKEIQIVKESSGKYSSGSQFSLTKWNEETEARMFVENNIYGVDINSESIEITKLSLFLKIASKNRKLIGLEKNIRFGNSLISDKTIDERGFCWETEFPEVMAFGKFDVIIGNPPYLNVKGIHQSHEHMVQYFKDNFMSATQRYDLYVLFVEKASKLLKTNGILSFIMPHKFINAQFGMGLRKYFLESKMLKSIISFGYNLVFDDSTTYTGIITLENLTNKEFEYAEIEKLKTKSIEGDLAYLTKNDFVTIQIDELNEKSWILNSGKNFKIMKKIKSTGKNIMTFFDTVMSGLQTGDNSLYVLTPIKDKGKNMILFSEKMNQEIELEKDILKPLLTGEDVKRYGYIDTPPHYVIYPYKIENNKQKPMEEDELKKNFPLTYQYLSKFKKELIKLRTSFKTNPKYWYALHRGRVLSNFEQEKIATPEISLGCNMTLDAKKFLHLEVVYSLLKKEDTVEDLRYFLGILNSKVMWFFLKNSGDVLRGGFFRFKTMYINPFSIPSSPDKQIEQEIIKLVDQNLALNKEFTEQQKIFLNLLQYNFKISIHSKTLKNFYTIEFDEFLKELKDKYKVQISIKDQVEWLNQFQLFQKKLTDVKNNIIRCDDEINKIVYSLYNFDDKEISIIEEEYPA